MRPTAATSMGSLDNTPPVPSPALATRLPPVLAPSHIFKGLEPFFPFGPETPLKTPPSLTVLSSDADLARQAAIQSLSPLEDLPPVPKALSWASRSDFGHLEKPPAGVLSEGAPI